MNLRPLYSSLEGSELGRSGSSHSDFTMLDWLVGQREFSQIVPDHVSLNFNRVPVFPSVDVNNGSNHLRKNNAVSEVSLDGLGLLSVWALFLGLSELLQESVISLMDTVGESPLLSGSHQLDQSVHVVFQQLLEFHSSVNALLKGLLLLLGRINLLSFACHLFCKFNYIKYFFP